MKAKSGIFITFLPDCINAHTSQTKGSVLDVALKAGVPILHSCGGYGTCGTCRVIIREGLENLAPRNEIELEMAIDRGFKPEERLCCQIEPVSGLVIETCYKKSE